MLAIVISSRWAGHVTTELVGRYRRHPGQVTAGARFLDVERRERMVSYLRDVAAAGEK